MDNNSFNQTTRNEKLVARIEESINYINSNIGDLKETDKQLRNELTTLRTEVINADRDVIMDLKELRRENDSAHKEVTDKIQVVSNTVQRWIGALIVVSVLIPSMPFLWDNFIQPSLTLAASALTLENDGSSTQNK